tara:strand:+ start:730 stop:954 length:225 start_codon:yes stop_codon:yes gene_type:complete
MKKLIVNVENPNGIEVELTAEEETQRQADLAKAETYNTADETARQEKADLKASAKAKLVAGEALTEDEANTIVL